MKLEQYMIAEESSAKELLVDTAFLALACAAIGVIGNAKNRKKERLEAELREKRNAEKAKELEALRAQVQQKYGYYPDGQDSPKWKAFMKKIYVAIVTDIRRSVATYNNNEAYLESVRKAFLKYCEVTSPDQLDKYDLDDYKEIRRGKFLTCDEEGPLGQSMEAYICVVPGQMYTFCTDVHYDITKVLSAKYADLIALGLLSLDNGDGDEGCIYISFSPKIKG